MADVSKHAAKKQSLPTYQTSSSSSGGGESSVGHTPMHTATASDTAELHFLVRKQPTHVYATETFSIEFSLEMSSDGSPPADVNVRISLEPLQASDTASLVVIQEPRLSPSRLTGKCVCQIAPTVVGTSGSYLVRLNAAGIACAESLPICVVQYKLRLQPSDDWSNVWYKDEGGREKSMECIVSVLDFHDQECPDLTQLDCRLCYEKTFGRPVPVMNQGILRLLGLDRSLSCQGHTKIRYRVEDVSKNHQGQSFVLEILTVAGDVAPCYTPAVVIRSKRNKRQRSHVTTGSTYTPVQQHVSYPEVPLPPHRLEGPDVMRLREAVQAVMQWSDEVANGIYPLQWQVMGYAHNPDGSLDYNRPYHNMINPNAFIARILAAYNESTRDHLQVLRRAVEQSGMLYNREGRGYEQREQYNPQHIMPQHAVPSHVPARLQFTPGGTPPPPSGVAMQKSIPGLSRGTAKVPQFSAAYYPQSSGGPPSPTTHGFSGQRRHATEPKPPNQDDDDNDDYIDESSVEYVLAKQFKAFQTGEKLGFPAYSASKEILGFYRESDTRVGVRHFVPIRRHAAYFGPTEFHQATEILEQAIAQNSEAVHAMKDWGSLVTLLDHALVYDWSKDIGRGDLPSSFGGGDMRR
jgi:hypothetical protein